MEEAFLNKQAPDLRCWWARNSFVHPPDSDLRTYARKWFITWPSGQWSSRVILHPRPPSDAKNIRLCCLASYRKRALCT